MCKILVLKVIQFDQTSHSHLDSRIDAWSVETNWGPLVDLAAPGVETTSSWINTAVGCLGQPADDCFLAQTGTSQSTAVVSGIIARHIGAMTELDFSGQTQATIESWLTSTATPDIIVQSMPSQGTTPNLLVHLLDC